MTIEEGISFTTSIAYDKDGNAMNSYTFMGLSTHTKPTDSKMAIGSIFFEMDTSNCYMWSGSEWKSL